MLLQISVNAYLTRFCMQTITVIVTDVHSLGEWPKNYAEQERSPCLLESYLK